MSTPFLVLEVLGTITFALSGVMAAARASMDWLGALVLAVVVAVLSIGYAAVNFVPVHPVGAPKSRA